MKKEWKFIEQTEDLDEAVLTIEDVRIFVEYAIKEWVDKSPTVYSDQFQIIIYAFNDAVWVEPAPLWITTIEEACEYAEKIAIKLIKDEAEKWQRNLKIWEAE